MKTLASLLLAFSMTGCLITTAPPTRVEKRPDNTSQKPPAGQNTCTNTLSQEYTFYFSGGLKQFNEKVSLSPERWFALTRTPVSGGEGDSCRTQLSCTKGSVHSIQDVSAAISDPAVQKALSANAFFGADGRPRDIPVFTLEGPAGKMQVGQPCPGLGAGQCLDIPEEIAKCVKVLREVYEQQKRLGDCSSMSASR